MTLISHGRVGPLNWHAVVQCSKDIRRSPNSPQYCNVLNATVLAILYLVC